MQSIHERFLDYRSRLESELGEDLTIDGLCGHLRIFQRANGHRHSIDDATTSWYALKKSADATTVLDLGSGIGSVGLAVLWGLPDESKLYCVEAQEISYRLLKANIECNGYDSRVNAVHADLRELNLARKFNLITGSPPYFPANAGIIPRDSQKAHARFELRGHVGDYAKTAARHLAEDGLFVFCFPYQQSERAVNLVEKQGLKIISRKDLIPNERSKPLFSLYSATLRTDLEFQPEAPLIVEGEDGRYSAEMMEVQRARGFKNLGENEIG